MYYEINVSKNGRHFFATAEYSIKNEEQMEKMYELFLEKFPEEEGYQLDVTKWSKQGKPIVFKGKRV